MTRFNSYTRQDMAERQAYQNTVDYSVYDQGPDFLMQTPKGFKVGNKFALAVERAANPEFMDTVSLAERSMISSAANRGSQHLAGSQISPYVNNEAYGQTRNDYSSYLVNLGMNEEEASLFAGSTYSEANRLREVQDFRGVLGVTPGTQRGYGKDVGFFESLGMGGLTRLDVLREMDNERPGAATPAGMVDLAVQLGYVDPKQAESLKPEDILAGLDGQIEYAKDDLSRVDETRFDEYADEANQRELNGFGRQVYMVDRAMQDLTGLATAVVNGEADPRALARAFSRMSDVIGPDVVGETMMLVSQRGFSTKSSWDKLAPDVREGLEFLGVSQEKFLANRPDISNDYSYAAAASNMLMQRAGEMTREVVLAEDMHDGWSSWTRRLTDTIKTDIGNDTTGLYFMLPTLAAGGAAGLLSKVPTTLGRMAAGGALDGAITMFPEGAVMSQMEQLGSFYSGSSAVTIDDTTTLSDALLYGAMGSVGGAGIASALVGVPRAFGYSLRGANYAGDFVAYAAAKASSTGAFGETAQTMARNALAVHEASAIDREAVSLVSNVLNEGMALRLRSGEVQALDVAREIIPKITRREGGGISSELEALLSPESLGKSNVSALEVSEAMAGIAKRLGPDAQISEEVVGNIMGEYLKQANRVSRLGEGDPRAARIALLDNAFKSGADGQIKRFMTTGEGTTLTDDAFMKLEKKVKKLASGKTLKGNQLKKLLRDVLTVDDEEIFDVMVGQVRKALAKDDTNKETLTSFNKMVDTVKTKSVEARKDAGLEKALRVRASLSAIDNERAISLAKGMGVSAGRLMAYVNDYAKFVGRPDDLKKLREQYPAAAEAVEKMNDDPKLALDFSEAVDSHFSFRAFEKSGAMDDVLEMEKFRKKISSGKALKSPEEAAKFQKLSKKLGVDLDQEQALARVKEMPTKDTPFRSLNDLQKGDILEQGIMRLDGADDGAVSPGSMSRDLNYIDSVFRETALGRKLDAMLSKVALWPQVQRKLVRNNNRIIRGAAQLITGQHITTRSYSSAGTVLSFESAVEGARREAMPYVSAMVNHRRLLGRKVSAMFDEELQYLRMRGEFVKGEIDVNALPAELRQAYSKLGGDQQLVDDLAKFNDELTDIFTRSMDEAKEAGIHVPTLDSRTYLPNRINGGLNEEEITTFVADFKALRSKQLLEPGAALSVDVLESLGWIKLTSGSSVDDLGRRTNKTFTIPESSPFAGMVPAGEDAQKWLRSNVLNKGIAGLRVFDEDLGRSAPSRRDAVSNLLDKPANLLAIKEGQEIAGNSPFMPVPESAASNAVSSAVARAIGNIDEELTTLERARSNMALLSRAEQETAEFITEADRIDRAISIRQSYLNSQTISRFANDGDPSMPRIEMSLNKQRELTLDDSLYSSLSAGHGSLVARLDEMLAIGMIDEAAKRVTMAAFVDADPSKIAGMSFVRLDQSSGLRLRGLASVPEDVEGSIVRIADIAQSDDASPGHAVAETIVHETAHIAFLSASPRLQRTFQSLYEQSRDGGNEIAELFEQFGIPSDRALSNVHEFVAYLSQISLVSNKMVVKSPATRTMFQKLKAFFLQLVDNIYFAKPKTQKAASMLEIGEFDAIERGVKDVFAKLGDDATIDRLMKKFDIVPAERIDEFGEAMPSARFDPQETFDGRKVKKAEDELAKITPELESLKARATDPENPLTEADEKKLMQLSQDAEEQQSILTKQEELFNAMSEEAPAPKATIESLATPDRPVRKKRKSYTQKLEEEDIAAKEAKAAKNASLASMADVAAEKEAKSVASVIDGVTIDAEATATDNFNLIFTALSEAYERSPKMLDRISGAYVLKADEITQLLEDGNLKEALSVLKTNIGDINDYQLTYGSQKGRKSAGKTASTTTDEGATVDVPAAAREEETFANALNDTEDELGDMIKILSTKSYATDAEKKDLVQRVKQLAFRQWVLQDQSRTGRVVADSKGAYKVKSKIGGWKSFSKELADHINKSLKEAGLDDKVSKSQLERGANAKFGAGFDELGEEVKVARQAYKEAAENRVGPTAEKISRLQAEEDVVSNPVAAREAAATSTGEVDYPFPGYQRFTTDELIDKVDESDSVFDFLSRGVMQKQEGEGSSYARELRDFYFARKGPDADVAPAPKAEAGDGTPPKDPPKTAKGAGDAGEEPKPELTLSEYLGKKSKKAQKTRGKINGNHRLSDTGQSLANLYRMAVLGSDASIYDPGYRSVLKKQGFAPDTPVLDVIGRRYLTHQSGGFKTDLAGSYQDRSELIGAVSNPRFERVFDDADLQDDEFGKELARRFAKTSSSAMTVANYTNHTLGSIRVQAMINDLFQTKGMLVADLFDGIKQSLDNQASRSINTGAANRTVNKNVGRDINDYMRDLQSMYLRSRGISPDATTSFEPMKRGSRITRNLTYSLLGGKFGMAVGFVEMPLAVLRSSGLNPIKMIQNTGIILNSWLESAQKGTSTFKPTQDFLSSMGANQNMMKHSVDDLVYMLEGLQANTLSRFQSTETEVLTEELMTSVGDRLRYHSSQVSSSIKGNKDWAEKIGDLLESSTAAAADVTGMASFMLPITQGVRGVARNFAQETILRHYDGLVQLGRQIGATDTEKMSTNEIIGAARKLRVPRNVAIYAAQSGLLSRNGQVLESLMRYLPADTKTGKKCSAGRVIDLNQLQRKIAESRQARESGALPSEFNLAGKESQQIDDALVPAMNQYFMFTIGEFSPELRGSMKISGAHPLMDLMYQLLTYPMAAYQALVANGVTARGATMTAGILTSLMGLEYFNRNAQRAMFAKDEETRQESQDKLARLATAQPSLDDVVEVIALYGTASPMFGAFGSYARDLVGAPLLRAVGHNERPFAKQPFISPAMSTAGRVVGQGMRFLGGIGTGVREGDFSQMRTAGSKLLSTGIDGLTPANGVIPATISQMMFDAPLSEKLATLDVARESGSARFHPAYTYPVMEDNSYLKAFTAENSPQDLSMVTPAERSADLLKNVPSTPIPQLGERPAPATPAQGSSPSSGLVDRLK